MVNRKGNPNWGKRPTAPAPAAAPTAFDKFVASAGIPEEKWAKSLRVRRWVEANREKHFVPEWLIEKMKLRVHGLRGIEDAI